MFFLILLFIWWFVGHLLRYPLDFIHTCPKKWHADLSTVPRCCQARTRCLPWVWRSTEVTTKASALGAAGAYHGLKESLWSAKCYVRSPLSYTVGVNSECKYQAFTHIKFQWHFQKALSEGRLMNKNITKYSFIAQAFFWTTSMQSICSVTGSCGKGN